MTSPQKENGYTPVANEILEQICKLKLNGTQYKIIIILWRYTYGFSRKEHELSESFIAKATNTHKIQLSKELSKLIESNIIKITRDATFTKPRILTFNKNYSEWKHIQLVNSLTPSKSNNATVSVITNTTVSEFTNQENKNKTKLKQDIDYFNLFWELYPKKVAKATAEKSFKKIKVNEELFKIMRATLEVQKESKQWQDKQFIPHASTWLNQRRWEDDISDSVSSQFDIRDEGVFQL